MPGNTRTTQANIPTRAARAEELAQWQRTYLPYFHTREMQATINWLIRDGGKAKPLSELYKEPGVEMKALLSAVSILSLRELIKITRDGPNSSGVTAQPTAKLRRLMKQYAEILARSVSE